MRMPEARGAATPRRLWSAARMGFRPGERAGLMSAVAIALVSALGALSVPRAAADEVTVAEGRKTPASVRALRSANAPRIGHLRQGDLAELLGAYRGWYRVRLANGRVGYVAARDTIVVVEPTPQTDLTVTFVDVENGDAILLQLGDVELLVDAGKSNAWKLGLGDALDAVQGPLETLFITHPHLDHYGGAADVLANLDVARVVTNGERRGPPRDRAAQKTWSYFEDAVSSEGLRVESLPVGTILTPTPGLTLEVLASGDPHGGRFRDTGVGTDINNDSLVLMVDYAGRRLLLTGDIEIAAGKALVDAYCVNRDPATCPKLRADVLKVPHHGSAHFAPALFRAVAPTWAVTSAANRGTALCLPRAESSEALHSLGAHLISTTAEGSGAAVLTISARGDLRWQLPPQPIFAWQKPTARNKRATCGAPITYAQGQ
jgi:beta-lactamase superfamily II metal-dependent hydrolase